MADDKPFLKRWSAQKMGNRAPAPAFRDPAPRERPQGSDDPDSSGDLSAGGDDAPADESREDIVAALPDIDTLDRDSDYTPFLADLVPQELAQKALRKLWRSDPVLSNLDGLNDYDDDYSSSAIIEQIVESVFETVKSAPDTDTQGGNEPDTPSTDALPSGVGEDIGEDIGAPDIPRANVSEPAAGRAEEGRAEGREEGREPGLSEP